MNSSSGLTAWGSSASASHHRHHWGTSATHANIIPSFPANSKLQNSPTFTTFCLNAGSGCWRELMQGLAPHARWFLRANT
ncbi:hypothetical protein P171DRAFT_432854 [Karstenula rhodostoma CBS 690.94]|uniref:Uncharacterized protein n=1 Tax=Karstenula rhodostoma CBS 690.94 TaxID=1392251 RepID=A0A9P4PI89_9PLEO|nr:hypothetical protein P171DRAFT_432854 [Karstenula rhodostoma CBS 690.94]